MSLLDITRRSAAAPSPIVGDPSPAGAPKHIEVEPSPPLLVPKSAVSTPERKKFIDAIVKGKGNVIDVPSAEGAKEPRVIRVDW